MNTATLAQAQVVIPKDVFRLFSELVTKLGGRILRQENAGEVIFVSPPLPECERVGTLLRAARLRADMTQKELAAAISVPQSHISEYEKNKRSIPQPKAEALAQVLKTVPTHFLPR